MNCIWDKIAIFYPQRARLQRGQKKKSACLVFILTMTLFKLLKCTVAKPPICCSCFCNEQLNKNVKCGKEYFTLNVSNIVLVIFKLFITFCWGGKKRII